MTLNNLSLKKVATLAEREVKSRKRFFPFGSSFFLKSQIPRPFKEDTLGWIDGWGNVVQFMKV